MLLSSHDEVQELKLDTVIRKLGTYGLWNHPSSFDIQQIVDALLDRSVPKFPLELWNVCENIEGFQSCSQ